MKQGHFILAAAIAAALSGLPGSLLARPSIGGTGAAVEAPRVTRAVNDRQLASIAASHPAITSHASSATPLAGDTAMNHLQLILNRSPLRSAEMETRIANQHNPESGQFQKWLTPKQFGDTFGIVDADITAITSWLRAEGFTVHGVYPNKMQIDFSGTTAQVNQAFHTQETVYTLRDGSHYVANASDISIPAALKPVIAGVVGLSQPPAQAQHVPASASLNPSTHRFELTGAAANSSHAMAIGPGGLRGYRGLVPDDLANMYGISRIRKNGVTGQGITIALVEYGAALDADYPNFVNQFNLGGYGGTFRNFTPQVGDLNNCYAGPQSDPPFEFYQSAEDMEMATAIAPGANIEVAYCSSEDANFDPITTNAYGGLFISMTNLVNGDERPNIISLTYPGYYATEKTIDAASKTALDLLAAQADAEGISVFAGTGDSGSNASFNGGQINAAPDVAALASSPHVTAVGNTDLADEVDGTTSTYFSSTPNANFGTALGYVPEIPENNSCGNGVVAKADGFASVVDFCKFMIARDPNANYVTSQSASGGASLVDSKPAWQRQVYNAAKDQSRDVPDVALFGGSGANTGDNAIVICAGYQLCEPDFSEAVFLEAGRSLSTPMFAGIQALIDQGLVMRGLTADQGNAAPTLYSIARQEYGGASGTAPASLAACSADKGNDGTANCVFHNITRGSSSSQCITFPGGDVTPNCYFYATVNPYGYGLVTIGLTTTDASPTSYGVGNKAYSAQPGWSFTSGLGSVNATNLLIAWRAFVNAPAASSK